MHRLDDLVTIGEASKLKGVSIDTLRRWEREGGATRKSEIYAFG